MKCMEAIRFAVRPGSSDRYFKESAYSSNLRLGFSETRFIRGSDGRNEWKPL